MKKLFKFKGQTLVELILAMGIAALIFPALLTGFISSREGKVQETKRMEAITLLKEAEQAVRSVRNNNWNTFAVNGTFYPALSGSVWTLVSGTTVTNGFTQAIEISDVSRNTAGDIVSSGGTNDPSSKKVVITISWTQPNISSVTSTTYYTRFSNLTREDTTDTQFKTGTLTNTQVTTTSGGEIILANNNKGKWCSPSFAKNAQGNEVSIDLPDGPPVAVDAKASTTSIDIPNDIYVATAPNTSNSIKFAYVTATANTDPPVPAQQGTFTLDSTKFSNASYVPTGIGLDNNFKTNDVKFYQSPSGKKYALLATNLPDKEVVAVLVDDNNPNNNNDTTGEYADPVNKIYKYWTYFNTNIYAGSLATTGFLNPSADAAETSNAGDNNGFETSPGRAYTSNNSFAVDTNSGNGIGTNCTGVDKDKHRFYDYGISLPSGASVDGIEVRLDAKVDNTTGAPKMCVQLSWDGGTTWTAAKTTSTLTTTKASYTLGGVADTWGRTWSDTELSNSNFRVRVIDVASDNNRDFSLDWVGVNIHSNSYSNDYAPHGYGATSLAVMSDKGYVVSGGYLYVFDLSTIDSKSTSQGLDMVGCRIEMDGYDCKPGSPAVDKKYNAGETGGTWSNVGGAAHNDCSDGGNIELYATNDIYPVTASGRNYIFAAVGAGTNPEFDIADVTDVPNSSTAPAISNNSCGRISGGNAGWKRISSYDFNSNPGTEEAANSVFAKSDGSRAYITSNGGVDSKQYYILNTTNKSAPTFLTGSPSTGPSSGYYNGGPPAPTADAELYPRRAMTVQNGVRAVLVGKDGIPNTNDAEEYQVLDNSYENTPTYCGGLNFDTGFNDLTSATELDGDNYVYMVANSTTNELKIIQGGPDNAIYVPSGTYESATYDAGNSSAFNSFTATVNQPATTTIKMQVAVAPAVGGSCAGASFTYVGPNGDTAAYFTPVGSVLSGTIPFGNYVSNAYQNPGRCFRYKVWLSTTDQTKTPYLYDLTANYSP